jgi:hypothetical protein
VVYQKAAVGDVSCSPRGGEGEESRGEGTENLQEMMPALRKRLGLPREHKKNGEKERRGGEAGKTRREKTGGGGRENNVKKRKDV